MCIAILKPQGKQIKKSTLKECFISNPDGSGFMFNQDNSLHIFKGYMTFEEFWASYNTQDTASKNTLIHFRIKTHVIISKENCHPFIISEEIGFIHNGIIDIDTKPLESDTMAFNREVLKKMPNIKTLIHNQSFQELLSFRIDGSKLVFLDNTGNYAIINEDLGLWDNDIWFSNDSYKPYKPKKKKWYNTFTGYNVYQKEEKVCFICSSILEESFEVENEMCEECLEEDRTYFQHLYDEHKKYGI